MSREKASMSAPPRAAIFSLRNIYGDKHFMSALFEFEDVARKVDAIDLFAPRRQRRFNSANRASAIMGNRLGIASSLGIDSIQLDNDYDLFVAFCHHPDDILKTEAIKGWRDRCKKSVCLIVELWPQDIDKFKGSMRLLKQFDHVFLNHSTSAKLLSDRIGKKCEFLPFGVDAELFCPYPNFPPRNIDFLSIGRRAPETHKALLNEAMGNRLHYVYDSLKGYYIFDPGEHRFLLSSMAQRSRFFSANPGKIDLAPDSGYPSEFGPRYFEGAAAGCVLVGESADNDAFRSIFNWPDAVLHHSYGSDNVAEVLAQFAEDPEREERVRKKNMTEMLLHHDWAYRWERILEAASLEPLGALEQRRQDLQSISNAIKSTEVVQPSRV